MNLTVERVNRGLSLNEAAREIGVARGTLRRAENGEMPKPSQAKKIADFYGVRVTDIWDVSGSPA